MGKRCRVCHEVKPTLDFKWRIGPQGSKYQDRKFEPCWIRTDLRKAEAESCATKVCSACKEEEMRDQFGKNPLYIGGLASRCKTCSQYSATQHHIRIIAEQENAETCVCQRCLSKVPSKDMTRGKPVCKNCATQQDANKYASDRQFKQKRILRSRLYKALHGANKSASTTELLGCTIQELELHLEAQFWPADDTHPAMSWSNQGLWHCDHIIPCSSFDLSDPAQQRQCFNFKNLQPLWAHDNIAKGDRLVWHPDSDAHVRAGKIDWHNAAGIFDNLSQAKDLSLEAKQAFEFEDGRTIHTSLETGAGMTAAPLPGAPTALAPTQLMESTNHHRITQPPKRRRQTLKEAANAKGQQRLKF